MGEGLWDLTKPLEGDSKDPNEDDDKDSSRKAKREKAASVLICNIDDSLINLTQSAGHNPRKIWSALQKYFQKPSRANKTRLLRSLLSVKMEEGEPLNSYFR